jgi:hypothetical protein
MKRSSTTLLAGAALAGLLTGSIASAATSTGNSTSSKAGVMAEKEGGKKGAVEKHDCAGKNSCKGKGGCKTGDNGCKGKNSCKGKGGCATNKKEGAAAPKEGAK